MCSKMLKCTNNNGSGNVLVSNRWQSIIWTNGGQVYWRVYTSLGLEYMYILDRHYDFQSVRFNWEYIYFEYVWAL